MNQKNSSFMTRTVEVAGDRGPLGIHVVPYCSSLSGRTLGLHIKGIEENSRSKREKLFQEDECIVQINDVPLQDRTFAQSQELFRQAMSASSVHLEVLPVANKPRYEKNLIGQLFTSDVKNTAVKPKSPMVVRAKTNSQPESRPGSKSEMSRPDTRSKTPEPALQSILPAELRSEASSSQRPSITPPAGDSSYSPTPRDPDQGQEDKNPVLAALANLANKKGGKRVKIDLKKGAEGLGFTVVTRDTSVHGPGPILVKNILPRGAAIKDGRLQPGDRILEVNGVDMAGRSQEELVAMLRSTKQGESVHVVVARQDDIFLPRELKGEDDGSVVLEDGREQLMYEIPLNETGSAGLGVSLKGNKSRETGEDLGIFIKSIIHGGAAYKDGRLSVNDQLIAVNGESLLGCSNHAAMETLRRSMSSEGNARGTIQLVVLRAPRQNQQMGEVNPTVKAPPPTFSTSHQPSLQTSTQEPRGHDPYQRAQGPYRAPDPEPGMNGQYGYSSSQHAPDPAATINGGYGHYGNGGEELEQSFPLPPSPGTVEEINRELPVAHPHHSGFPTRSHAPADSYPSRQFISDKDNQPRSRTSKSMDMVADESNMGSLMGSRNTSAAEGTLGPTLGLWKSSSLESLQTAVSEARHTHSQAQVPFHRPRPHMVRGRGCNQSFRIAIDKSYEGPSEDEDYLSEHSSGFETPASSSSRQDLDADEEKSEKSKGKKKEKKKKGKKKVQSVDDPEKKSKKKGFALLRFGRKKEDKSKDASKSSKSKMEALSEEELDRIPNTLDGYEPRHAKVPSGHVTPNIEDDDSDPNYARINHFLRPPSPHSSANRTPSPGLAPPTSDQLDGLYAKVNKSRPPPADSDQRQQGVRREFQQPRAAPGYEDLDAARRRVLDYDPHRVAPRGAESRPEHRYEEIDPPYPPQPRRDPYDYPTHSRPVSRDPAHYSDPPPSSQSRYHPSSPHTGQQPRGPYRQEVPPSPTTAHRGRHYYEAAGGRVDVYRQASPGRYASPERIPATREHYASPDRYHYRDEKQPDDRRKNPLIGAV